MTTSQHAYDLGELDFREARRKVSEAARQETARPTRVALPAPDRRAVRAASHAAVDVPGSLSLFVPGAGQLLRGDVAKGLFFLSFTGLIASLAWAFLVSLDRMAATLALLDYPAPAATWALGALFAAGCVLHLGNVLDANAPHARAGGPPHPAVSAAASVLVPGWGQILNGDRWRAAAFVALLWVAGAGWLLASPAAGQLLADMGLYLPPWLHALTLPVVRWTVPAIVWTLAVYDAAHRARAA